MKGCEDSPPSKRVCRREAGIGDESQSLLQQLIIKLSSLVHTERSDNLEDLGIAIS